MLRGDCAGHFSESKSCVAGKQVTFISSRSAVKVESITLVDREVPRKPNRSLPRVVELCAWKPNMSGLLAHEPRPPTRQGHAAGLGTGMTAAVNADSLTPTPQALPVVAPMSQMIIVSVKNVPISPWYSARLQHLATYRIAVAFGVCLLL